MVCCCVFPLSPIPSSGLSRARERQLERRPKPQTSTVDLPDPEPQTANLTNPKNPKCGSSVGSNPTNPNCGSSVGSNLFVAQVLFCSKVICSSMCGSCNCFLKRLGLSPLSANPCGFGPSENVLDKPVFIRPFRGIRLPFSEFRDIIGENICSARLTENW